MGVRGEGANMTNSQNPQLSSDDEVPKAHSAHTCEAYLSSVRTDAIKRGHWMDRACATIERAAGIYDIEEYGGEIAARVTAHCEFCARAEAILQRGAK